MYKIFKKLVYVGNGNGISQSAGQNLMCILIKGIYADRGFEVCTCKCPLCSRLIRLMFMACEISCDA